MISYSFEHPISDSRAQLISSLIEFSLKHLLNCKVPSIKINVETERNLIDDSSESAYTTIDRNQKEFTIHLDQDLTIPQMLKVVAHEAVHIKQFIGNEHINEQNDSSNRIHPYWDDPLEIEAYGRELGLVIMWIRETGMSKKSWAKNILMQ